MLLPLLLCAEGCNSGLAGGEPASPAAGAKGPAAKGAGSGAPVSLARPVPVSAEEGFPSSLYVERDVKVTARRTGILEKVLVDRGQSVKAGQALAELESDLAQHELERTEQELRLANSDYDRFHSLNAEKVVSPQEFQRAEINRDLARTAVALARSALERCTVRAPFDGTVVERWAVVGERVVEDDSTPLFRIAAHDPLRARIDVPESRAAGLSLGSRAALTTPEGAPLGSARVVFVGPASDAASGTVPIIVQVEGGGRKAPIGSSVRVQLEGSASRQPTPVRLPQEALQDPAALEGDTVILFVNHAGRAQARQVQLVKTDGNSITVRGPVSASDQVILPPPGGLSDGEAVVPREGP